METKVMSSYTKPMFIPEKSTRNESKGTVDLIKSVLEPEYMLFCVAGLIIF
jgi:hypothetical protein